MNMLKTISCVVLCIQLLYSCKEYDLEPLPTNNGRIKSIVEFEMEEACKRTDFFYKENKLIAWKTFLINDTGAWEEKEIYTLTYKGETVKLIHEKIRDKEVSGHMMYTFQINWGKIVEKKVSRLAAPPCNDCWHYNYTYSNSKLIELEKRIKTTNNKWETCRKLIYTYDNNRLMQCRDYTNYDYTNLKLDYLRIYNYKNNRLAGWECGTVVENQDWYPTQKIEFEYNANNISTRNFYVWNQSTGEWYLKASVNYKYNNEMLIEENTLAGTRTSYTYESGTGNAALFYYEPDCFNETRPLLKSSF